MTKSKKESLLSRAGDVLNERKIHGKMADKSKCDIGVCCRTEKERIIMTIVVVHFQHYLRKTKFKTSEKNITKLLNRTKEALLYVYPPNGGK